MDFRKSFQTVPNQFLPLSTEVSEPFVIPQVSPVSPAASPILEAIEEIDEDLSRLG